MDNIESLLGFLDDLMKLQYLDSYWITSRGGSVSCDVSEVVGWFYSIFLPDLLKRGDLPDDVRMFVKELLK